MSFFYAQDIRFIIVILPLISIGLSIILDYFFRLTNIKVVIISVLLIILGYLFIPGLGQRNKEVSIITLKKQIGLNFRHEETPWNYLAISEFNKFFNRPNYRNSYLGTVLPPFFVQFYSNSTYKYLPITTNQDFMGGTQGLLTKIEVNNIKMLYKKLLKKGEKVFISNYYLNNLASWHQDFKDLISKFNNKLVHQGCWQTCNIYQLKLK
jgi:hypothetical protein